MKILASILDHLSVGCFRTNLKAFLICGFSALFMQMYYTVSKNNLHHRPQVCICPTGEQSLGCKLCLKQNDN